jgi:hypothetical protein
MVAGVCQQPAGEGHSLRKKKKYCWLISCERKVPWRKVPWLASYERKLPWLAMHAVEWVMFRDGGGVSNGYPRFFSSVI